MAAGTGNRMDARSGLRRNARNDRFAIVDDKLAIWDNGSVVDNDELAAEIGKKNGCKW